jgi:hypothetical protein
MGAGRLMERIEGAYERGRNGSSAKIQDAERYVARW